MLRSFSKYTGNQVFPGTEGLAQTNSIYPFLDNLTAGMAVMKEDWNHIVVTVLSFNTSF